VLEELGMKVKLEYGRSGLEVELPVSVEIIRSRHVEGLKDEAGAIIQALRNPVQAEPLRDWVKPGSRIVISHSDITRATPNHRLIPVILKELEDAGVQPGQVTLLNSLGTHRFQTEHELRTMLGDEVVDNYRLIQHNAFDDASLVSLGKTSFGHPVRLNRELVEADVRILTGLIEPHFFAGFSGGPKAVLPALAGSESVFTNHGYAMIAHPRATWGITLGNPIWEEMMEMAQRINPAFLVNVAINADRQITGVFAGDIREAHTRGCAFVRESAMIKVEKPYDIVLTTNSGYPLDQNLYQAVKGMSAAAQIVRQGGAILCAAACEDGLPDHGKYAELLRRAGSPQGVLDMVSEPGFSEHDQWQVQTQAMVQQKADVYVYSHNLTDEQIRNALFTPCRDIPVLLRELTQIYGTCVCVMPEGPLTIAYL
jgi:nickel-dependent lactate racemase